MRIGLNVRNVAAQNSSGADLYVQQLAHYVPKADPNNTYYLFVDKQATTDQRKALQNHNVKVVQIPFTRDKQYLRALNFLTRLYKLDLVHFPVGAIPNSIKVPYVVSVLDLTFELFPEFYAPDDLVKQKNTRAIAEHAIGVIAISEATKKDLVKFYKLPSNKVAVTHLAPKSLANQARGKLGATPSKPFLLFVGNIQPRKNLTRAVEALALVPKADRPLLYVVGNAQDKNEAAKLHKIIKNKKLEQDVILSGYLSERELTSLYQHCLAIYYPSLYEGFGYNVLEAFMYKKPIILSDNSSLPEIAGKAGIYVDPLSPEDMARGIRQVLKPNQKLKDKIAIGSTRLKKFTPERMAKATVDAYQKFTEVVQ